MIVVVPPYQFKMPNCDFFAYGHDYKDVLDRVFSLDCRVFELSSAFDCELVEFRDTHHIRDHFELGDWSAAQFASILLQIYPKQAGGKINIKRIELNSSACDGATFRFSCNGWGMIQLYLSGIVEDDLRACHTNHNSGKRARKYESTAPELGKAADWDFGAVSSVSRRINSWIRSNAVGKYGSQPILENAASFFDLE